MLCLVCDAELAMYESKNEVVDYCEHCQDIWLARDEIDRLLDGNLARPSKLGKQSKKKSDSSLQNDGLSYCKDELYRKEPEHKSRFADTIHAFD